MAKYALWSLLALVVLAVPARSIGGDAGPVIAWALAFGPGAAVIALSHRFREPALSLPFVLLSTAFRMAAAGAGAAIVLWAVPAIHREPFLIWLGGMYLLALAVEVCLTLPIGSLRVLFPAGTRHASAVTNVPEAGR